MTKFRFLLAAAALVPTISFIACTPANTQALRPPQSLLEMTDGVEKRLAANSDEVTFARSTDAANPGIVITTQPGKNDYPGVNIKPNGDSWDLSQFGHIEAHITNLGTKPIYASLRVDNAGNWQDNPWNAESASIEPGKSGVVTVIFGYSFNYKPSFALTPKAITNLVLFTGKSDVAQIYRLDSLVANGPAGEKPPVAPDAVRLFPQNGFILGGGAAVDAAKQINAQGAQGTLDGQTVKVTFPANTQNPSVVFKPPIGRWNLSDSLQVKVKLKNEGAAPIAPRARIETNGGPSPWATATLAPGATGEITIPFVGPVPIKVGDKSTENPITSNAVAGVTIAADQDAAERSITIQSIQAGMPALDLPKWLGQRPPVEGQWTKTLDDEFTSKTLDTSIWDIYGANYWDKASHWSKDNVILGDGKVKLRYERKTGYNNDDPKEQQTNYQAGYLHTYNKWAQRYGYFEARMKLPKAPGLWPAFWLMPDRGPAGGPEQWRRQRTEDGGMEFDIMEHLTGWGPTRYNIAQHWDGYDKNHKSNGADRIYVQPDKDGYITSGLLWTPGSAIYYCNGREIARWENERVSSVPEMIMFTIPQGGWDNTPLEDAKLPADFEIDYVRVWQRKDLASPADGKIVQTVPVTAVAPAPK